MGFGVFFFSLSSQAIDARRGEPPRNFHIACLLFPSLVPQEQQPLLRCRRHGPLPFQNLPPQPFGRRLRLNHPLDARPPALLQQRQLRAHGALLRVPARRLDGLDAGARVGQLGLDAAQQGLELGV